MEKLLDDAEVKKLAGKDAKVLTYPELSNYANLDHLFGHKNKVIILYLNDRDGNNFIGHWVLLLRTKDKTGREVIEFNDSYSNEIDEYFDDVHTGERRRLGQDRGFLSRLLYDYCQYSNPDAKLIYNEIPFQKVAPNINTCGRWVGLRGHFSEIPLDIYQREFKKLKREGYNLDKVVVALTNQLLRRK
jgi:hypothetical protein